MRDYMDWLVYGLLGAIIAIFLFWKVIFLRDPERRAPKGKVLVSPCDGKVVKIIAFDEKEQKKLKIQKGILGKIYTYTKDVASKGTVVSIFMSPLDVHVTRVPLSGKLLKVTHVSGKFSPVTSLEAGLVNEKVEFLMDTKTIGKYKFMLIAGFLARRIEPWVSKGAILKTGDKSGLINLGSQVTMILPSNVKLMIKEGDRVVSGESIVGKY